MRRARRSGTRPFRCRKPRRGDRLRLRSWRRRRSFAPAGRLSVAPAASAVRSLREPGRQRLRGLFGPRSLWFVFDCFPPPCPELRSAPRPVFFRRPFRARNFPPRPCPEPSAGAAFGRENFCLPVEISSLRYGPSALLPIDRGCSFAADASRRGPAPARLGARAPFRRVLSTSSALRMRHCARLAAIPIV